MELILSSDSLQTRTGTKDTVSLTLYVLCCVQVINTAFSSGAELGKESSDMCQQLLKQLDNFDK